MGRLGMAVIQKPTGNSLPLSAVSRRQALVRISSLAAGVALPLFPSPQSLNAAPKESRTPEERLQKQFGLVRLTGGVWGLPLEVELKEKLAQLQVLRESVVTAEKELEDRAAANRRAWAEAAPAMETLKQAIGKLSPTDPQRAAITQQLTSLERNVSEPSRLCCRGEVRARLIAFSRDRSLLQLALLWIRTHAPRLVEEYARLAKINEVAAVLKQLEGEKLGPLKSYIPEVKRLADYDKLVFTDWLPVYQQAGQTRFSVLVNDQAPVTFTWSEESHGQLLLPASTLESCGLSLPKSAPQQKVNLGDRHLLAHEVTVPSLRLGRHVVKSLSAFVLPPEGEDLGARLPRNALTGLKVSIELERLRLTMGQ